ncbi:MAG: hypothetical protein C0P74_011910 [Gammaproteobacteria bacterium]|nr:hypothetical protein [Gammaproteobacteria bacterium]
MAYEKHLYLILYPNPALVASQLTPEAFARHYLIGSIRHYSGKLIFAQVDPAFRHPYFDIDTAMKALVPHPDGTPKRTKFISTYRVLEHMDLDAIKRLYLSTAEAHVLELEPQAYDKVHQEGYLRTFAEIAPLSMLIMSPMDMREFGRYITQPGNPKGCPKLFYTQIELDVDEFLETFEKNPFMPAPFPFLHPSKLRDAILEMKQRPDKKTKGLSLSCPLDQISFKAIRHGFMFAAQDQAKFFPMPSLHDLETKHYQFWRYI